MICPACGWTNVSQHTDANGTTYHCQHVACDHCWTVPHQKRQRAHRPLPGGDTGRLRAVLEWAKELGW